VGTEFDDGRLRITRISAPPGLRVEGEVDATCRTAFSAVLLSALARHPGDLRLDLGRLHHVDLGGLRVLAATGRSLDDGRFLVLDPLPGRIRTLLELAGWDEIPGLRLGAGALR
jgi:anti-anti-sigma regulatory factor